MQLYKAVRLANWGSTLLSPLRFWCDNRCLHVGWSVGRSRGFPRVLLFPTRQRPHERKLQYIGDCFRLDLSCNNMFCDFGKLNMKYSWQNITAECWTHLFSIFPWICTSFVKTAASLIRCNAYLYTWVFGPRVDCNGLGWFRTRTTLLRIRVRGVPCGPGVNRNCFEWFRIRTKQRRITVLEIPIGPGDNRKWLGWFRNHTTLCRIRVRAVPIVPWVTEDSQWPCITYIYTFPSLHHGNNCG